VDSCHDIILFPHQFGCPLTRISEIHMSYIPFVYVLLCVYGEVGWHPRIPLQGAQLSSIVDDAHQLDEDEDDENDDGEDGCCWRKYSSSGTLRKLRTFEIYINKYNIVILNARATFI